MQKLSFSHLSIKKVKRPKDRQESLFLFENDKHYLDWHYVKNDICPKQGCQLKLYWNIKHTIIRCRSKLHSFVLTAKAYDEIVSGKRLESWKQLNNDLRK